MAPYRDDGEGLDLPGSIVETVDAMRSFSRWQITQTAMSHRRALTAGTIAAAAAVACGTSGMIIFVGFRWGRSPPGVPGIEMPHVERRPQSPE
jgi:hypothetical protein